MVELIGLGHDRIVVDLKHIQYISSAGFRALLIARIWVGPGLDEQCPVYVVGLDSHS